MLCLCLKPCCVGPMGRVLVSSGRRRRSSTFTEGHRSEMGRYPDPEQAGLPDPPAAAPLLHRWEDLGGVRPMTT